jgi:hypothetical protein
MKARHIQYVIDQFDLRESDDLRLLLNSLRDDLKGTCMADFEYITKKPLSTQRIGNVLTGLVNQGMIKRQEGCYEIVQCDRSFTNLRMQKFSFLLNRLRKASSEDIGYGELSYLIYPQRRNNIIQGVILREGRVSEDQPSYKLNKVDVKALERKILEQSDKLAKDLMTLFYESERKPDESFHECFLRLRKSKARPNRYLPMVVINMGGIIPAETVKDIGCMKQPPSE